MMALGSAAAEVGLSRIRWCAAAMRTGGRCTHMFQVMKGGRNTDRTELAVSQAGDEDFMLNEGESVKPNVFL